MNFKESVPSFGELLQDEMEATHSHIGSSGIEEKPILSDPEGASEDALFGVSKDEPVLYKNGKRIETLETIQPIKKRNREKLSSVQNDLPEDRGKDTLTENDVEFAKPISDEEFKKREMVAPIISEIEDFVDKAEFIPGDLYTKAQMLNDPFLNDYILSLPDNTVVFLDQDGNKTKTISQIRETYTALDEQKDIEQKKKLDAQILEKTERPENFMENVRREEIQKSYDSSKGKTLALDESIFANQPNTTKHNAENPNRGISLKDIKIRPKETAPSIETPSISESTPTSGTLEGLLSSAETKDDLIAIIERSNDLQDGLWGTQQTYSRDELIALIEANWIGDVGIDHLPRTAGFREAVDRVREYERVHLGKYAEKQTTAAELDPVIQAGIKMGDALGVPESSRIYDHNKEDNSLVYNYIKNPATEEDAKKNKSIFGRLWAKLKGKR